MINMLNVSSLSNLKNLWMCVSVCASTFTCIWYLYLMFEVIDVCKLQKRNDIHCREVSQSMSGDFVFWKVILNIADPLDVLFVLSFDTLIC